MSVSDEHHQRVELRVSQRAGEVRLSVHTPDEGLNRNLRENLSELSGRLSQNNYQSEEWQPRAAEPEQSAGQRWFGGNDRDGEPEARQGNDGADGRERPEDDGGRNRRKWMEEFEARLAERRRNGRKTR